MYLGKYALHHFYLQWSFVVATITEIPPLVLLPNFLVQRRVLKPLRTQTGGTIMVCTLSIKYKKNGGGGDSQDVSCSNKKCLKDH